MLDNNPRFHALDGWRGVCALLVALFHMPVNTFIVTNPFFSNAHLFVDFFFVLSGFVLAHAYGSRLNKPSDAIVFAVRRAGRLWPLHVSLLLWLFGLETGRLALSLAGISVTRPAFSGNNSITLALQHVFLVQAVRPEPDLSWNGPSWSISTEFWAYMVFAAITVGAPRFKTLIKLLVIILSFGLVYYFSTTGMAVVACLGFFRCLFGFFAGQLLYCIFVSPPSLAWWSRRGVLATTLLEALSTLVVVIFVTLSQKTAYSILAPLIFAGLICAFAAERGLISRFMTATPFTLLGLYSYSIYMVHNPIFGALQASLHFIERLTHVRLFVDQVTPTEGTLHLINFGGEFAMLCFTVLVLLCVIGVSHFTWKSIEVRGQAAFNRLAASIRNRADGGAEPVPSYSGSADLSGAHH